LIRLTVIDDQGLARCVTSASYFRITGGSVWIGPSASGVKPLVLHVGGQWHHDGSGWSGLRFEGKCRLVFGLARDPVSVSGEFDGLSIVGQTLLANGIPFANYDTVLEAWRGVSTDTWWLAFRIEVTDLRESIPATDEPNASSAGPPDASATAKHASPDLHSPHAPTSRARRSASGR
jgi:hypothetical protein